jgi:hypothetical protein
MHLQMLITIHQGSKRKVSVGFISCIVGPHDVTHLILVNLHIQEHGNYNHSLRLGFYLQEQLLWLPRLLSVSLLKRVSKFLDF